MRASSAAAADKEVVLVPTEMLTDVVVEPLLVEQALRDREVEDEHLRRPERLVAAEAEETRGPPLPRPELRPIETKRRRAKLHLVAYLVGNALFWILWGAVSISTDPWYWWPLVPTAGWTLVLALNLWHVYGRVSR